MEVARDAKELLASDLIKDPDLACWSFVTASGDDALMGEKEAVPCMHRVQLAHYHVQLAPAGLANCGENVASLPNQAFFSSTLDMF